MLVSQAPGQRKRRPASRTLEPVQGIAQYRYDDNGNYMGGTIVLDASASDPDGDSLTFEWSVQATSGSPSLASTSGNSNVLTLDSFSVGTVVVTVSDGRGGTDEQSYQFAPP